jgi:hypothetical protein
MPSVRQLGIDEIEKNLDLVDVDLVGIVGALARQKSVA